MHWRLMSTLLVSQIKLASPESKLIATDCSGSGKHYVPNENVCVVDSNGLYTNTYEFAVDFCAEQRNGYLPKVLSEQKISILKSSYPIYNIWTSFATGDTGATGKDRYYDIHAEKVNTSVAEFTVDMADSDDACVYLKLPISRPALFDYDCARTSFFVCEIDMNEGEQPYKNGPWIIFGRIFLQIPDENYCDRLSQFHSTVVYQQQCIVLLKGVGRSHESKGSVCSEEFGFRGRLAMGDDQKKWEIMVALGGGQFSLIGLSQNVSEGEPANGYYWDNGKAMLLDKAWLPGDPNNGNNEHFGAIIGPGLIDLAKNVVSENVICEFDLNHGGLTNMDPIDAFVYNCVVSLKGHVIGSSCFFASGASPMDWATCASELGPKGAAPAVIYTDDVLTLLHKHVLQYSKKYWTGYRADSTGNAQFVDGQGEPLGGAANPPNRRPLLFGMGREAEPGKCAILRKSYSMSSYSEWLDCASANQIYCLGEIVGPSQEYSMMYRNQRIGPKDLYVETHSNLTDVRQCAFKCEMLMGCLSFAYDANGRCYLLPFKARDGLKANIAKLVVPAVNINQYDRYY